MKFCDLIPFHLLRSTQFACNWVFDRRMGAFGWLLVVRSCGLTCLTFCHLFLAMMVYHLFLVDCHFVGAFALRNTFVWRICACGGSMDFVDFCVSPFGTFFLFVDFDKIRFLGTELQIVSICTYFQQDSLKSCALLSVDAISYTARQTASGNRRLHLWCVSLGTTLTFTRLTSPMQLSGIWPSFVGIYVMCLILLFGRKNSSSGSLVLAQSRCLFLGATHFLSGFVFLALTPRIF